MADKKIMNRDLYTFWRSKGLMRSTFTNTHEALFCYVKDQIPKWAVDDPAFLEALQNKIRGFGSTLYKKWSAARSNEMYFLKKEILWLDLEFQIPDKNQRTAPARRQLFPSSSKSGNTSYDESFDSKTKLFDQLSHRNKLRRTQHLRETVPPLELAFATGSVLYNEGHRAAADLVWKSTQFSPARALKIRRSYTEESKQCDSEPSIEETLALKIKTGMGKADYQACREFALKYQSKIFPSYDRILEAKKLCCPTGLEVNKMGATVPLQNLLDHTCDRIIGTLDFSTEFPIEEEYCSISLMCKWGCDGSSGYNEYMQLFKGSLPDDYIPVDYTGEEEDTESTQKFEHCETIFMFSMVPLRLYAECRNNTEKEVLWENPKSSSKRYCRPIKFRYMKENIENTKREVEEIENEIANLQPFTKSINGKNLVVNYKMIMTMLDTKVINALTDTSSQRCYICGCYPSEMNDLNKIGKLSVREENLKYGLSILHMWIKMLECILHISYKLEWKKTTTHGASSVERRSMQTRKEDVKAAVWKELGVRVDKVVQGMGSSNTGNVARRFFKDPEKAAEATGVDKELIERFGIILLVLSSGRKIDTVKFNKYCDSTAQLYVKLYNWYRMPPSLHKVLVHGSQAIEYALLPMGQLSEEAQETRNKDVRYIRQRHTRKISHLAVTTDLMNGLLESSDPLIASYNCQKDEVAKEELPLEAQELLTLDN